MSEHNSNRIKLLLNRLLIPVIIALIPFTPKFYEHLTSPDYHFIYDQDYEKNPLHEMNRMFENFIENIDQYKASLNNNSDLLMEEIGKEVYKSLPAMLSGLGFKPYDKLHVDVFNLSNTKDLKNIKINFIGCRGYKSFETLPDKFGTVDKKNNENNKNSVTILYPSIPPSRYGYGSAAHISYYGEDTSGCSATVTAELIDGSAAQGKKVRKIREYLKEESLTSRHYSRMGDYFFKLIVLAALIFFYNKIRSLSHKN